MISRTWLLDAAERVALTFAEAFVAALVLAGTFDLSSLHAAEVGALSAGLAAAKSVIAAKLGGTVSPASLAPVKPAVKRSRHPESGQLGLRLAVAVLIVLVAIGLGLAVHPLFWLLLLAVVLVLLIP